MNLLRVNFLIFVAFNWSVLHAQDALSRIDRINADNNLADIKPSYSYANRLSARIKPNITFALDDSIIGFAEVQISTASDGSITSRRLTKSSGYVGWDNAVLKAIDRTEILPRDIDGKVPPQLLLSFSPRDTAVAENLVRNPAVIDLKNCPKPSYPLDSRKLEEEGTVNLKFLINIDGTVVRSVIAQTSGHDKLDSAAMDALSKCKFKPATFNGVAEKSWAQIKYTWRLDPRKTQDNGKFIAHEKTDKEHSVKLNVVKDSNKNQSDAELKKQLQVDKEANSKKAEEARIAHEGDGSPDDLTCKKYGLKPQTQGYSECRMRLDLTRQNTLLEQTKAAAASKANAQALDDAKRAELQRRYEEVERQNAMIANRQSQCRFIQSAEYAKPALGGFLESMSRANSAYDNCMAGVPQINTTCSKDAFGNIACTSR